MESNRINPETIRLAMVMLESIKDVMGEPEFSKWLLTSLREKQADLQAGRDERDPGRLDRRFSSGISTKDLVGSQSWLAALRRGSTKGGK